ncbi:MAG: hypothetical protein LUE86_02060 [Clostridiales bacterium]|nr:hypothetical protein [Clostridiales bacterium]
MDELEELLRDVSDTYDDFVAGVKSSVRDDEEALQKIIQFIKENPKKTSSDIIEYLDELGI